METRSRNTGAQLQNFDVWQSKIVRSFKREKKRFLARANAHERKIMLLPAGRCVNMRHPEIGVFLSRYIILVSDRSRGNFFLVCKQLYIKQCVHGLHNFAEYARDDRSMEQVVNGMTIELYGLLSTAHASMLSSSLPYLYILPKPHKYPLM
jgi:hypothetical protein